MKAYFNQNRLGTHGLRRCRFSQDVALHFHARQFGPQPTDLHLLSAHDLAVRKLSAPLSLLYQSALAQLNSVCSTTPRDLPAVAMLCRLSPATQLPA